MGEKAPKEPPPPGYAWYDDVACWINLAGDYDYLTNGYYLSQELELAGEPVRPTCREILDAYITPLMIEKASAAGLDVLPYYITNSYFEPPVLIDTLNPFMNRQRVVRSPAQQEKAARSLTRNFTYAICCQELTDDLRLRHIRTFLGWTRHTPYLPVARSIWEIFGIPIAKVRVAESGSRPPVLTGIWPLPWCDLTGPEREKLEGALSWRR